MANPQYKCKGCVHRVSRNTLLASGGQCPHCGTQMHHNEWISGTKDPSRLIGMKTRERHLLKQLASLAGVSIEELMAAGLRQKIRVWLEQPDVTKAIKDDLMINKLYGDN